MIIGFQKEDITNWKNQLSRYEIRKRGQFLFDQQREKLFLPIKNHKSQDKSHDSLKRYESAQLPSQQKQQKHEQIDRALKRYMYRRFNHEKQYDIVTNHPLGGSMIESQFERKRKNNAPIRNLYDPITGKKLRDEYLKDRNILLPVKHQKKGVDHSRQFNIVNLEYKKDNELRYELQKKELTDKLLSKYRDSHNYDKIYSRYYNPEEQERYWSSKKEQNIKNASLDYQSKLPPSYQYRQRYIQDLTKPLPKRLQQLDRARQEKRKSHHGKYIFEAKKEINNIQEYEKAEARILNRAKNIKNLKINKKSFAISNAGENSNESAIGKIKSYGFDIK